MPTLGKLTNAKPQWRARVLLASAAALALAACGSDITGETTSGENANDPAVTAALNDQIMVDPDLTSQNDRNSALTGGGPPNGALPPEGPPAGSAEDALADAMAQIGGKTRLMIAPEPARVDPEECTQCKAAAAVTLGAKAQQSTKPAEKCDRPITYDMAWSQRLPADLPVYPRSHLKEAAGVDGSSCNIRVVNFTTRVGLKDVVDYYYTRARRAQYDAEYVLRGEDYVLGGTRASDDAAYVLFLKPTSDGGTEVDIVTSGGGG